MTCKKKEGRFSSAELFGITEEKAEALTKEMMHIKIDAETMEAIANGMKLPKTEDAFKAFIFGRIVERNEDSGPGALIAMLGGEGNAGNTR